MYCDLKETHGFNFWVPVVLTLIFLFSALMSQWNSVYLSSFNVSHPFVQFLLKRTKLFLSSLACVLSLTRAVKSGFVVHQVSKAMDTQQDRVEHRYQASSCSTLNRRIWMVKHLQGDFHNPCTEVEIRMLFIIIKTKVSLSRSQTAVFTVLILVG